MHSTTARLGLVAALPLIIAMGACSGGSSSPDTDVAEVELPATLPNVDMSTFTLPVDSYKLTPAESKALVDRRNMATSACLARFGVKADLRATVIAPLGDSNERRYFLWSADRAGKYGYKWPEISDRSPSKGPALAADVEKILTGEGPARIGGIAVPEGGCEGEANRSIAYESGKRRSSILLEMQSRSYNLMWRNSRVIAAVEAWSACMAASGFQYADPKQANDDPRFSGRKVSNLEKRTATADVRCKADHDVIDTMAAVESAIQVRMIDRHRSDMSVVRHDLERQRKLISDSK